MSTALATEPYRPERTQRIQSVPTVAYQRPRAPAPEIPAWCQHVDDTIAAIARFGSSPTSLVLLVFGMTLIGSLHTA